MPGKKSPQKSSHWYSNSRLHPLRVVIDGNEANVSQRVGSNVYAYHLLKHLEELTRSHPQITFTIVLSAPPVGDWPRSRLGWEYKVIKPRFFWTQWALPLYLYLHQDNFDVFFTPGHYAPRLCPIPYVSSVMDLAFIEFSSQFKTTDHFQLSKWTSYSVKHAKKIVTISQFSKQEILRLYHRASQDVVVAYPSVSSAQHYILETRRKAILRKFGLKGPYFLYVGTLQPRKNLIQLIEAFEQLCRKTVTVSPYSKSKPKGHSSSSQIKLVIAGKVGWLANDILERIKKSPFNNQIVLTGFIDEATKQLLIVQATATVLVGLYEGFGIPPLESLFYQTIPIVANSSSLPEVVGKAGILVDPQKTDSIAAGLYTAFTLTQKERAQFLRAARAQLNNFSWSKSADIVLDTLWHLHYPSLS